VSARACVRACVRAFVRARGPVRVRVLVRVPVCACACVCRCVCASALARRSAIMAGRSWRGAPGGWRSALTSDVRLLYGSAFSASGNRLGLRRCDGVQAQQCSAGPRHSGFGVVMGGMGGG